MVEIQNKKYTVAHDRTGAKDAKEWYDYLCGTHISVDSAQKLGLKPKEG